MRLVRRVATLAAGTALALGSVAVAAPVAHANIGGPSSGSTGPFDGSWGRTGDSGATQTIVFDGTNISGKGGCNRFFGTVKLKGGNKVDFGQVGTTMMACEQAIMDDEAEFLAVLDGATKVKIKGDKLTISGPDGKLVFQNAKQPRK